MPIISCSAVPSGSPKFSKHKRNFQRNDQHHRVSPVKQELSQERYIKELNILQGLRVHTFHEVNSPRSLAPHSPLSTVRCNFESLEAYGLFQ